MVTVAEINARERQLQEAERKATQQASKKIPERSFGGGVSPKEQKQAIKTRQEAIQSLTEIKSEKEELSKLKSKVIERKRLERERKSQLRKSRRKSRKRLEFSSQQRAKQREKFKKQGLEPIIVGGKLTGFEDIKTGQSIQLKDIDSGVNINILKRLEKANVIQLKGARVTVKEEVLRQSLPVGERESPQSDPGQTFASPPKKKTRTQIALEKISRVNEFVAQRTTIPLGSFLNRRTGATVGGVSEKVGGVVSRGTTVLGGQILPDVLPGQKASSRAKKEFVTGASESIIKDFRDKPVTQGVFFIAGGAIGTGLKTIGKTAQVISKTPPAKAVITQVIKLNAGDTTRAVIKTTTIAVGGGFAVKFGEDIRVEAVSKNTIREVGGVVGTELKNLALIGGGTSVGFKSFDFASDVIRTAGRKQINKEIIVAPEIFQGQKFPKIKKGQTAGQLQKEFSVPIQQLQETQGIPRAFHATAIKFNKETIAKSGSSELPGLFVAPKLSVNFLRVLRKEKSPVFGISGFFGVSEPTAIRIELKSIGLAPGVRASQSKLTPLNKELKQFFKTQAPKGSAQIPFIKTEKEAIIPIETVIKTESSKFFFKLGGRRIPINQAKALGVPGKFTVPKTSVSLKKDLSKFNRSTKSLSSSGRIVKGPPLISPLSSLPRSIRKSLISSSTSPLQRRSFGGGSSSSLVSGPRSSILPISSSIPGGSSGRGSSTGRGGGGSSSNGRPTTRITPPNISSIPAVIVVPKIKRLPKEKGLTEGFRPFIIRKGKKVFLGGPLPKGLALRKGEKEAKITLSATFGVDPTGIKIKGRDVQFKPSSKLFRGFRIRKGKKISLKDIFIQRKGKRLSSGTERKRIQRAKRRKSK